MLTASKVKNAGIGVHSDGAGRYGLFLEVRQGPRGITRRYKQRIRIGGEGGRGGRRTMITIGDARFVTLAEAREMAYANARAAYRGEPLVAGAPKLRAATAPRAVPVLREAIEQVLALQRPGWKSGASTERNWIASFKHCGPILDRPVDKIEVADIRAILTSQIEAGRVPLARALRQRLRTVLDWAVAEGFRKTNCANGELDAVLPRANHRAEHRAAVAVADVPGALRAIETAGPATWAGARAALRFAILTGTRTNETIGARFEEIDFETATWTVPAARMKNGEAHTVPLSGPALAVLKAQRERHGPAGLIFRSPRGLRLDQAALRKVAKRAGIGGSPHGFRQSLRNWAAERGIDRVIAELCLAHRLGSDTERAYFTSDMIAARREVMADWAAHCTG